MVGEREDGLSAAELERALDLDGLVPVYQPCYDLRTGALVAVEALARLRHPVSGELLGPARFMPAAEDSGLVTRLDLAMAAKAFQQTAVWRSLPGGEGLCVAINLSPSDLDDARVAEHIGRLADEAGLPIEAVIIELTETVLSHADRGHDQVLAAISDLGCNVTLDDFGTGNASFTYLQRFRVDGIKIDRSFVQSLGSGGPNQQVAESLVRFCLSLGLHVVAEGIEEPEQVDALRRLGCPFAQGFLMSPPVAPDHLATLLAAGPAAALAARSATDLPDDRTVPGERPVPDQGVGTTSERPRARPLAPVLAALVVLLLVSLTALALLGQHQAESSLRNAAVERLATIDAVAAEGIDQEISAVRTEITAASRSASLRRALVERDDGRMRAELSALSSNAERAYSVSLYDAGGRLLAVDPFVPGVRGRSFAFRDWYAGATRSESAYVSGAFRLVTRDRPWAIAVAAAVRDGAGGRVGYVVGTFSLSGLQRDVDDVLSRHGVVATLVDGHHSVLAGPDGRGLGARTSDPRLLAARAPSAHGAGAQWVIRPVPAVNGWLLAEQSGHDVLGSYPAAARVFRWLVITLAVGACGLVLLWARADRRRRRLEDELAAAHGWLTNILTSTPTPFVVCDDLGRVQIANPAMADLLGTSTEALEGAELSSWLPTGEQQRAAPGVFLANVVTVGGDVRAVEVRSQVLGDPWGERMHLHALVDVTPHRREQDRLRAQGRTDPLTGAGNRRALQQALKVAVGDRTSSYALVMMDLDGFKAVNDTLGHLVGDELLSTVAATLKSVVRPNDTVTRVGGDEFVTVVRLEGAGQRDAVARRLRDRVQRALDQHPSADRVRVGVSAGTALVGADGATAEELLSIADERMYDAKRSTG